MLGVRQWRHVALRHRPFCVSWQHRLCRWWLAHFYLLFMKDSYVYSSMEQWLQSVDHEQFPIQMIQNSKHNKWLEIFDFQPKLLWPERWLKFMASGEDDDNKIPRAKHREHRLHSKGNVVNTATANMYRSSDKILQLQWKWSRWREGTPTADVSKSDGEIRQRLQFRVKLSSSMQR